MRKRVLLFFCVIFTLTLSFLFFASPVSAAILFQDNFDDGDANGWTVARNMLWSAQSFSCQNSGSEANWVVQNGKYGIVINGSGCVTETIPDDFVWDSSWNDYIFEADVIFVDGVDANIAFRYTTIPNNDWYGYHFIIQSTPSNSSIVLQRVWNTNLFSNSMPYTLEHNKTYHLKIIVNGEHIQLFINDSLALDYPDAGGRFPTGRMALQASVGTAPNSEVWFDNVVVRSIDELQPQANVPVVLVPGFGGSWNTSDIISGGSGGNWKKTPFIKVYDNIRSTFINNGKYAEGDDYFEFYYDWRRPADSIADSLKDYIENTVLSGKPVGTKVNLVGHSFGGLISRSYGQKYGVDKINKLVTSGSPHEGAIPAWKAWSGAELGDRWSWQWIALQLYLQIHKDNYSSPVSAVHDLSPSLSNLTPIFDFTKNSSNQVIDVTTMNSFNSYLNNLKISIETGLKDLMTTIAGNENANGDSIEWIKLGGRSLSDKLLGKWPDGRPEAYEYTGEGDLTVLEKSALIANTDQKVVGTSHIELMETSAGIQAILDSLGLTTFTPATGSNSPNRNPALIFFLHSPANIKVTDPNGNEAGFGVSNPMSNAIYSEVDKLLVIFDAVDGDYGVEVVGNGTGSYSLDLGQLSSAGEKWSTTEESVTDGEVDSYTLKFNSGNPKDFPLIDDTGKMQLNLAKVKLNELKEYINSQSFSTSYKKQLSRYIDKLILMLERAITSIESGKYANASRYARAAMTGSYSLRMKVDKLGRGGRIEDGVKAKIKTVSHEAGLLVMEGYIATLNKGGRTPNQTRVNRDISVAQKVKNKVESRVSSNQENHPLGIVLSLSEEMLGDSQNSLGDSEFSRASAQALVSRLLSLESSKIK